MSTSVIVLLAIVFVAAIIICGPVLVMKVAEFSHNRTHKTTFLLNKKKSEKKFKK